MEEQCIDTQRGRGVLTRQSKLNTTQDYIASLFNNENFSDVLFVVGENAGRQRIFAHKLILSGRSNVFKDMLFDECVASKSKEIELPDVTPAGFLALLKFIYCDKNDINAGNVLSAWYAGIKFKMPSFQVLCEQFLISSLRIDNVFQRLTLAQHFGGNLLTANCLQLIDKNSVACLATDGFLDINLDCLCLVLERDTLVIEEIKLFNSVLRWAETKCKELNLESTPENQRRVLDKALKLIRYPLMSIRDFANGPVESGLLTCQEAVEIYQFFLVVPQKSELNFIKRPRKIDKLKTGKPPSTVFVKKATALPVQPVPQDLSLPGKQGIRAEAKNK